MSRTDTASRVIRAAAADIYRALIDPTALVEWLPPAGMTAKLHTFDARVGGGYRMSLRYDDATHASHGKTSQHEDVVRARFLELAPDERIVQEVEFESDDPAFAGAMKMTWSLAAQREGTRITITCENVPAGIQKADHDAGLRSTLDNLAAFVERTVARDVTGA